LLVLDDARFGALFSGNSRAEVPIVGRLARGTVIVSGQVDRLAVTADAVLIADYKTNRIAREDGRQRPFGSPQRFADVPAPYIRQLALYRAVLAQLYPEKAIHAALLWTDTLDLMEIPAAMLDEAWRGIVTSL